MMAYEIPQQLEHKEKIMWGLTFGQLGWAFLFGGIALILLLRKGSLVWNASLAIVPVIIGVAFIFFDAFEWIKRIVLFLRKRDLTLDADGISTYHGIEEIKSGILKAGNDLAYIEIFPTNYKIKTETEKASINTGFQKFLNSFEFPVQIVVTTQKLSIDSYLASLKQLAKDKNLLASFETFISDYIQKHEMRNRRFFLVIPKNTELDIQCKLVSERLKSLGLENRRLNSDQIVEFIRLFVNAKEITPENRSLLERAIGLESIRNHYDYLEVNGKFCRVICASGYPRSVDGGFLDKIISAEGDFDISLHIEPFNINTMLIMLNQELQKQRADLYSEQLRGSITPSLEIKYQDTRKVLEELQKGEEKLFQVSLYINCKADTKEKLDLLTSKVESELNSVMIIPEIPKFRQLEGYRSMLPVAKNYLQMRRNVGTKALSAFFPFTSPFLSLEQKGVMLGLNRNNVPLIRDIFGLSNPNGLVLATSGAGKSYFTKLLILRQLMNGTRVIVIDPQSEYIDLVKAYNGQVVTISKNSSTIINPLDPMGHDLLEKRLSLMDLFKIMFGDITEAQRSILDRAITATYIAVEKSRAKKMPRLQDLYNTLEEQSKVASAIEQISYGSLINRLYVFTAGVFGFLNRQTSVDFTAPLVCFNIGSMPKQVKPVIMFLILDYVYMKMKESKDQKLLVVDEAWSLLSQAEEASYLFEIVKTCRKFNMGLLLITQDVLDLVNSKAGHAVLANSAYTLLLRQKPAIIEQVLKTFSLSNHEKEYLLTATKGAGIFIADNDHQEIQVISSPQEHTLITTNPNESKVSVEPKDTILSYDKVYHLDKDLSATTLNEMSNEGFVPKALIPIGSTKSFNYIVKAQGPEGEVHSFYVQQIKEWLENKKGFTVEKSTSVNPDLIFADGKGKMHYWEFETGDNFDKRKKDLRTKLSQLERDHPEAIIILLESTLRPNYQSMTRLKIITRRDIPTFVETLPHILVENSISASSRNLGKRRKTRKKSNS